VIEGRTAAMTWDDKDDDDDDDDATSAAALNILAKSLAYVSLSNTPLLHVAPSPSCCPLARSNRLRKSTHADEADVTG
jgi:hypothetical protein